MTKKNISITITLPKKTYDALLLCCKEGKISESYYIELSLNSCLNWDLLFKKY